MRKDRIKMLTKNIKFFNNIVREVHKCSFTGQHALKKAANYEKDFVQAKPYDDIPGPKSTPIFGYFWNFLPVVGKYKGIPEHSLHIMFNKEFGNLVRLRDLKFRKDLVICFDPKDIEMIFRTEGIWPMRNILESIKHYRINLRKDDFKGYGGVFTSDGKEWQDARSIINPILMQPRTVKQYIKPMVVIANDFVSRIQELAGRHPQQEMPDDFTNELNKWALESIGVFAFDTRLGLLKGDLDPRSQQQILINDILDFFVLLYEIDVLPSLSKYMSTPKWRKYVAVLDRITSFLQNQLDVTEAKIEKEKHIEKPPHEMSAVEKLLKIDRIYAFGNAMDILVGGVETTSRTMAGILYLLAVHTDEQEKLRQEILKVLPEKSTELTAEKLEEMPYLRAVIKECMRLIPITLATARHTTSDIVLSGYQIRKGTDLVMAQLPLYWSEKYFTDPKKFKPDRWIRQDRVKSDLNPWVFLPFGFGPRSCVGKRLAQLEMETLVSKIIRNFKLEWHQEEMKYKTNLFYGIDSPLKFRAIPIA